MKFPHYTTHLNPIFLWVLLTLSCYRLQRMVTGDTWLPFTLFRTYLNKKAIPAAKEARHNFWTEAAELANCSWCFGFWTSMAVFAIAAKVLTVPLPVLQFLAAAAVVGYLGQSEAD